MFKRKVQRNIAEVKDTRGLFKVRTLLHWSVKPITYGLQKSAIIVGIHWRKSVVCHESRPTFFDGRLQTCLLSIGWLSGNMELWLFDRRTGVNKHCWQVFSFIWF